MVYFSWNEKNGTQHSKTTILSIAGMFYLLIKFLAAHTYTEVWFHFTAVEIRSIATGKIRSLNEIICSVKAMPSALTIMSKKLYSGMYFK